MTTSRQRKVGVPIYIIYYHGLNINKRTTSIQIDKTKKFAMLTVEEKNEQSHGHPKVQRMSFVNSSLAGMMNYLKIKRISFNKF